MISDTYPRLQRRGVSSTFAGNNPVYLAQPASSPQIDETPANNPAPRLPQVNGNDSRASAPLPGAPAALFALPDSLKLTGSIADWLAGLAGGTPRNAIQDAPSSPGQLGELYRDEPVRPWFLQGRR